MRRQKDFSVKPKYNNQNFTNEYRYTGFYILYIMKMVLQHGTKLFKNYIAYINLLYRSQCSNFIESEAMKGKLNVIQKTNPVEDGSNASKHFTRRANDYAITQN